MAQEVQEQPVISNAVVAFAKVDKVEATIGDIITYNLTVDHAGGVTAPIPDLSAYLSDFTVVSTEREKEKLVDSRHIQSINVKIQAAEVGSFIIEPVTVSYTVPQNLRATYGESGTVKTSRIYIEIKSVLNPGELEGDIEDIKPIEEIRVLSPLLIALLVLLPLLAVLAAFIFYRKFFGRKPEKELLPHEKAIKRLNELRDDRLIETGKHKEFFFRISEILREYLYLRFDIPALESLSDDIKEQIHTCEDINPDNKKFLYDFLDTTDYYKYTDTAFPYDMREILNYTFDFVNISKKLPEAEVQKRK